MEHLGVGNADDDARMEQEREIRILGASSGWPCEAERDAVSDLPDLSRGEGEPFEPLFRVF